MTWVALLFSAFLNPPSPGQQDGRAKVPDPAAQKEAEKLVREVFRDEFSRKGRPERLSLARKLLSQATETKDDPATRFVLLSQASELAGQAGNASLALQAIGELEAGFQVDPVRLKENALEVAATNSTSAEDQQSLSEAALQVADEAISREAYDSAEKLARMSGVSARKAKNIALATRADLKLKEVSDLRTRAEKIKRARDVLSSSPEDPAANGQVGFYLCVNLGQWEQGLPLLAKADNPGAKALAARDLKQPQETSQQVALGDGWWDLGEKEDATTRMALRKRASFWYAKAAPNVTGLAKAKIEKRLAEIPGAKLAPGAIELLRLVDPGKDAVVGEWVFEGTTLVCAKAVSAARIQIPYIPPEEYDLSVVLERKSGSQGANVGLSNGTVQFHLVIDSFEQNKYASGLSLIDGRLPILPIRNETTREGALLPKDRPVTIEAFVRKTGVKMVADGVTIFDWSGDLSRLSNLDQLKVPNPRTLYLCGWDAKYHFSKMVLTPISGKGERLR